jgi:mediator of RNA polymerase II transcription subunit 31
MKATRGEARERLLAELEFVQLLACPGYLHSLASKGYFDDARFVKYLAYLQYFRDPSYAALLRFPNALHSLELLQLQSFRNECKSPGFEGRFAEQLRTALRDDGDGSS